MVEVKFGSTEHLKSYHGFDGKQSISLQVGDVLAVSDEKAKKLLADFPKNFSKVADGTAAKQVGKKQVAAKEKSEEDNSGAKALEAAQEAVQKGEDTLKAARRELEDVPAQGMAGSAKKKKELTAKRGKAEKACDKAEKALAKAEEKLDDLEGEQE